MKPSERHPNGYFIAARSDTATDLLKTNKNAFVLLYVIAARARRTNRINRFNLKPGEALIGDHREYGLTEQEYRTAKRFLEKHGFATFTATTKGTIAMIANTEVFDINAEQPNEQQNERATDEQRTNNGQLTTIKNEKNERSAKNANKETLDMSALGSAPMPFPPTLEQVLLFADQQDLDRVFSEKFWQVNQKNGWYAKGRPIGNWQGALKSFVQRCEADRNREPRPSKSHSVDPVREVLEHLERESLIKVRISSEVLDLVERALKSVNMDVRGVKEMISQKVRQWRGTTWEKWLIPGTLFKRGKHGKFTRYYADAQVESDN